MVDDFSILLLARRCAPRLRRSRRDMIGGLYQHARLAFDGCAPAPDKCRAGTPPARLSDTCFEGDGKFYYATA